MGPKTACVEGHLGWALVARDYQPPKNVNRIITWLARRGLGRSFELTTTGRKTGKRRSVPVTPITVEGADYLVAPYGPVGWVRNARANPGAILRRGRRVRHVRLVDVTDRVPEVVLAYYQRESFPRKYMDVPDDPTVEDFVASGGSFPVFRVQA